MCLYGGQDGSELTQLRINFTNPSRELECSDIRQSPVPFALKNYRTEHGDHSNSSL